MHFKCAVIDPTASSTPQSGDGILCLITSLCVSPLTVHRSPTTYPNIPGRINPGWNVMALDLAVFATSMYLQKRSIRTLKDPWINYGSRNPTIMLSP